MCGNEQGTASHPHVVLRLLGLPDPDLVASFLIWKGGMTQDQVIDHVAAAICKAGGRSWRNAPKSRKDRYRAMALAAVTTLDEIATEGAKQ